MINPFKANASILNIPIKCNEIQLNRSYMIGTLILNMLCLVSSTFSKNEDLAPTGKKDWTFKVNHRNTRKCLAGVYLLKVNNTS